MTDRSLGQEYPLEEGMATHSSTLAWRVPWTEEPGGYSLWGHKELDMTKQIQHAWTKQVSTQACIQRTVNNH